MSLSQLNVAHLKRVIVLFNKKKSLLSKLKIIDDELESFMSGDAPKSERVSPRKRRTLSPAARAKIAAAQKKRWAKAKGDKKG